MSSKAGSIRTRKYKTELCRQTLDGNECKFREKCCFAHNLSELRYIPMNLKYKTKLCRNYNEQGYCSYGRRCNFIHTANTGPNESLVNQ
jgi:hypothetical protein